MAVVGMEGLVARLRCLLTMPSRPHQHHQSPPPRQPQLQEEREEGGSLALQSSYGDRQRPHVSLTTVSLTVSSTRCSYSQAEVGYRLNPKSQPCPDWRDAVSGAASVVQVLLHTVQVSCS